MKYRWIVVWLVLVILQLITYWWVGYAGTYNESASPVMEAGLLDLTQEVRAVYRAELISSEEADKTASGYGSGSVLAREEILLRLRDSEKDLFAGGREVRLSPELESWLKEKNKEQPFMEEDETNDYLRTLMGWVAQLADGQIEGISRALLLPSDLNGFPSLSFEAHGPVGQLAGYLVSLPEQDPRWNLDEFDLVREASGGDWWIRGSFVFEGKESE